MMMVSRPRHQLSKQNNTENSPIILSLNLLQINVSERHKFLIGFQFNETILHRFKTHALCIPNIFKRDFHIQHVSGLSCTKWKSTNRGTYWMSSACDGTSSSCRLNDRVDLNLAASSYKRKRPVILIWHTTSRCSLLDSGELRYNDAVF